MPIQKCFSVSNTNFALLSLIRICEFDSELLRLPDIVQLGLGVAFLTALASFEKTTISALSPYKYMPLVHTAATQTSQLRPLSLCWESHLFQELKSHWWLLSQLLWKFSSSMPFTLPTKMFLSVTHISAKTPHLSQAQARIITRSSLKQYFHVLGPAKAAAFPDLHTLRGSGNAGRISGKGKVSGWKTFIIFLASSQTVPRPLSRFDTLPQVRLGTTENQDGRH